MTNKKFKKAAMALALTACVAATPLAANAETLKTQPAHRLLLPLIMPRPTRRKPRKPNCL